MAEVSKLVYTAQSKLYFYCRDAVCQFVLENDAVPLNPFRMFDYFLGDRVSRESIRCANRAVLERADELWVFGTTLADGVVVELAQASRAGKPIRFFTISPNPLDIRTVEPMDLEFESEVEFKSGLGRASLNDWMTNGRADRVVSALGRSSELSGH